MALNFHQNETFSSFLKKKSLAVNMWGLAHIVPNSLTANIDKIDFYPSKNPFVLHSFHRFWCKKTEKRKEKKTDSDYAFRRDAAKNWELTWDTSNLHAKPAQRVIKLQEKKVKVSKDFPSKSEYFKSRLIGWYTNIHFLLTGRSTFIRRDLLVFDPKKVMSHFDLSRKPL